MIITDDGVIFVNVISVGGEGLVIIISGSLVEVLVLLLARIFTV